MRETKFIEQNQKKWAEYEQMLQNGEMDSEKLNELFVHITDDLSYSRTYYPNRTVRAFLNGLGGKVFQKISSHESFPKSRIKQFWVSELPQIVWDSRKALLMALALFVTAFFIGVFSCTIDPEFPRIILGDHYVDMTLKNIADGDAMKVYKDRDMFGMSGSIALNNLWVAFITMIFGMIASIGTVYIMLYNGIMVGAFQYLFVQQGKFWESFLTIWIHGTLEISAIIIAGGAGLVAGSGWLFPGTYTRLEAFRLSLVRGIKLYLGVVPIIVLAAFFEGYLTRATETPDYIRALFIGLNLAFVLWYFVWYPWYIAKRSPDLRNQERELPATNKLALNLREIKSGGQVFYETMAIFIKHFNSIGLFTAIMSVAFVCFLNYTWIADNPESAIFEQGFLNIFDDASKLQSVTYYDLATWLHLPLLALAAIVGYRAVHHEIPDTSARGESIISELLSFLILGTGAAVLSFVYGLKINMFSLATMICFTPIVCFLGYSMYAGSGFAGLRLFTGVKACLTGLYLSLFALMLYLFLETPVYSFLMELVTSNTRITTDAFSTRIYGLSTSFFVIWIFYLFMSASAIGAALLFYSGLEEKDAFSLYEEIPNIGSQARIRGLMKE